MEQLARVVDTFEAPIGEVWALIAAYGAEKAWIEGVLKSSVEGSGIGALRTMTFRDFVAEEVLEECDPKTYRFVYRLLDPAPLPIEGGFGTMQLTALAPDRTRLEWTSNAQSMQGEKALLSEQVTTMFMASVANIKRYLRG